MDNYLNKSHKIVAILEYAKRLYEQDLDTEPGSKDFGAGAIWAIGCLLNERNELDTNSEIPSSFEELLEKISSYNLKRQFCEGCPVKQSAELAWKMLKIAPLKITISNTHAQAE